jgi:hypothetical protein
MRTHLHGAEQDNAQHGFTGQNLGLKQVGDKTWLVSFMDYDLSFFDQETTRLQPTANPSEAKALAVSMDNETPQSHSTQTKRACLSASP